jgi:hypothetical protein
LLGPNSAPSGSASGSSASNATTQSLNGLLGAGLP